MTSFSSPRRHAAGALILSTLASLTTGCSESVTPLSQRLRSFPEKLGDSVSVEKHEVAGARHLLVHIGQIHTRPEARSIDHLVNLAQQSQDEITKVLRTVVKEWNLQEVYCEGVVYGSRLTGAQTKILEFLKPRAPESITESEIKAYVDNVVQSLQRLGTAQDACDKARNTLTSQDGKQIVRTSIVDDERKAYAFAMAQAGAVDKLVAEGVLAGRGFENVELHRSHERALRTPRIAFGLIDDLREVASSHAGEQREDWFIKQLVTDGVTEACVVLGAAHDLRNNVDSWNESHPDQKLSLITVITGTTQDYLDKHPNAQIDENSGWLIQKTKNK